MVFDTAKSELKELLELTDSVARKQATLSAMNYSISPTDAFWEKMYADCIRITELTRTYGLE